jgi:hypothetical protein
VTHTYPADALGMADVVVTRLQDITWEFVSRFDRRPGTGGL